MKLLYTLPVLAVLPTVSFAAGDFSHIKPFVGYDLSIVSVNNLTLKDDAGNKVKTDSFGFNDNNVGDFVFGIEIDDVVAVSLNPSVSTMKTKVSGAGTTKSKLNEIDAEFDIYVTRGSNFKPFVSLGAGYVSMDGDIKASGAIFEIGLGCRQYINSNIYLNANLAYTFTMEMDVKEISGADVDDVTMRSTGFNLSIGAGYRF